MIFVAVSFGILFILSIGEILLYEPPKKETPRHFVYPSTYRTGDGDAAWKKHQMIQKAMMRGAGNGRSKDNSAESYKKL